MTPTTRFTVLGQEAAVRVVVVIAATIWAAVVAVRAVVANIVHQPIRWPPALSVSRSVRQAAQVVEVLRSQETAAQAQQHGGNRQATLTLILAAAVFQTQTTL